jgi:NAD(P)-dependent dehydrogenase (short-subunit alcohol dehydrogenase family)
VTTARGWTVEDIPDLSGRVAVVTGANSGLGLATARQLAGHGATVVLACRDPQRASVAAGDVGSGATGAPPETVALDLADLASIRAAAGHIGRVHDGVDILVNNAGVMALPPMLTAEGFELQFGTNHLGHFALSALLLPMLSARPRPRVVTVTSLAAWTGSLRLDDLQSRRAYDPWAAYARSKQANLLFALELHRRAVTSGSRIASLAAHPGWSATHLVANGPGRFAGPAGRAVARVATAAAVPPRSGARAQLRAATDPGAPGGALYAPRGPLQLFGAPRRVRPPRPGRDATLAAGLWEASESLTGLRLVP